MSHNVCDVNFAGKNYRLPRYSIGQQVLCCFKNGMVTGVFSYAGGSVIYHVDFDDGSFPRDVYEHELLSTGVKQEDCLFGFRVGDTVVDTAALIELISVVVGFDKKRSAVKIRPIKSKWSYLVSPDDLKFVNTRSLRRSKDRNVLNEE